MAVDFRDEAPAILKDYLIYKQTIKNMSKKTVDEYFIARDALLLLRSR